jgi:hypothetical protein
MSWLKKDKNVEDTASGFHINCNCNAVHMRNGKVVKPESKITIYVKRIKQWISQKD